VRINDGQRFAQSIHEPCLARGYEQLMKRHLSRRRRLLDG